MIKFITNHLFISILIAFAIVCLAMYIFIKIIDWQEARAMKKREQNDRLSLSDHDWRKTAWEDI